MAGIFQEKITETPKLDKTEDTDQKSKTKEKYDPSTSGGEVTSSDHIRIPDNRNKT